MDAPDRNPFETLPNKNEEPLPTGAVLVVGGGIAGMQASLDLADAGFKVYLVEKEPAIGGHMSALDKTFPTNDCAMCTISPRLVDTAGHPNIEVLTNSELSNLDGVPGRFTATLHRRPRYIDPARCTGCGDCAAVCPVNLPDLYNGSLGTHKAAYKLYPQAVPNAYAIDKKGIAPCRDACPAGQRAQGYIALIREGRYADALRVIKEENPFPGICGRICNHRCETACNRNLVDEPIAIAALKRFVVDQVYAQPYESPRPAQRKYSERVAIVGSGPCGLTAAKDLALAGYGVTIFEALPLAGGMLRVGVPEFRLPPWIVDREVQEILDLGVELRLNTPVHGLEPLFEQGFNAILLCIGAHEGRKLPIPGADHPDVLLNSSFLRDVRLGNRPDFKGRHILVLGGGNVAMDCARSAVRLGAKRVEMAFLETRESMPAHVDEVREAEEEGILLHPALSFTRILTAEGGVAGVEAVEVSFMKFEADGSLNLQTVPNSEHVLACDMVIFAIGQRCGLAVLDEKSQVNITKQRTIAIDPVSYATSRKGVFAAGDATQGTSYVVEAIASGHRSAESIAAYLAGERGAFQPPAAAPERVVVRMTPEEIEGKLQRGEIHRQPRRQVNTLRGEARRQSFEEVSLGFTEEEARLEASRCLQCGGCSECLSCVYKCAANAIVMNDAPSTQQLEVGAVILAAGFDPYDARQSGEYGFGRYPNVITSLQYERILSPSGPYQGHLQRPSDGRQPKKIAWIQCVGSRTAERNWCSAVCCMYATKQAMITQEHASAVECTIFYIDFRAYGKGFDAYYERAKACGVRYLRAMPSEIQSDGDTGDLRISYAPPGGQITTEEFDLVVLSVGMQAPASMASLAKNMGITLTESGFCQTNLGLTSGGAEPTPLDSSRPGVYICGPLVEPKDIPETLVSASGAAARAMTLLASARFTEIHPRDYPPETDVAGQSPKVGVFVCHCGTNIAGVVDVPAVADYARSLPEVALSNHFLFACSTDSQARIREAIQTHHLNRVVVASCTPRTHERLFQNTIRQAGLNYYLFELANIRDQCSWVHRDQPEAATEKAKDLVRMAVAKARLDQPLQRKNLDCNHDALVIGGGLAGMTAALELADQGFQVALIERQAKLGGNLRHLHFMLNHQSPEKLLQNYVERTLNHPRIHTYLNTEIASLEGSLGNFKTRLRPSGSDAGLPGETEIHHGVVIVATGGQAYQPKQYLYGQDERVLTQLEFEELVSQPEQLPAGLGPVVMIQCVGSRNAEHPYCSRVCCSQAIKNALEFKKIRPQTEVYILYQDIRTYGLLEKHYRQARQAGITFLRFEADRPPVVAKDEALRVTIHDAMLDEDVVLEAGRVVLSVATVPQPDAVQLAQILKVPLTAEGFYQEAHMKLRPVEFASEGIFLCGMAHYPKKAVTESITQALAAASRAATVLSKRAIEIEPIISHVNIDRCDGCAYCVDPCPFKAIQLIEYQNEAGQTKKRVVVDEAVCKGCGTCQATCPKDAIFIAHFRLEQLRAMTMAALGR